MLPCSAVAVSYDSNYCIFRPSGDEMSICGRGDILTLLLPPPKKKIEKKRFN